MYTGSCLGQELLSCVMNKFKDPGLVPRKAKHGRILLTGHTYLMIRSSQKLFDGYLDDRWGSLAIYQSLIDECLHQTHSDLVL